jgi:ABC-type multidrug transport system ATPase subunit
LDGFDLKLRNLVTYIPPEKNLPEKVILKGINTHVRSGQMTALIGASGSGKTTLLNFLAGRQDESQQFLNSYEYYINNTQI